MIQNHQTGTERIRFNVERVDYRQRTPLGLTTKDRDDLMDVVIEHLMG